MSVALLGTCRLKIKEDLSYFIHARKMRFSVFGLQKLTFARRIVKHGQGEAQVREDQMMEVDEV